MYDIVFAKIGFVISLILDLQLRLHTMSTVSQKMVIKLSINAEPKSGDQNSDEESDYDPKFEGNLYDIMTKLEFCNYTCQTNSKYCHWFDLD